MVERGVQQGLGAEHVGLDENAWIFDRPVDVAFRGEMNDRVRPILLKNIPDNRRVDYIAVYKGAIGLIRDRSKIFPAPRIGERV